jgi:hypothetical protein
MLMLFAAAVGLVAAGLSGTLWAAISGQVPSAAMLFIRDAKIPLRVLMLVFHAPLMILRAAVTLILKGKPLGLAALAIGGAWSFFEGVFILTQVFAIP